MVTKIDAKKCIHQKQRQKRGTKESTEMDTVINRQIRFRTQIRPRSPLIFYVSDSVDSDTLSNPKVGWAFMAPEMLKRGATSNSGAAADMWALGVMTFTLLVGNYPFIGNEPLTLFARIRSRNISSRIENFASPEGRIMVYSLLCKDPSERPSAQRLKLCHWLEARNEVKNPQLTAVAQPSQVECSLRQLHSHLVQMAQQQPPQPRGSLPRVSSDRRLNRAMVRRSPFLDHLIKARLFQEHARMTMYRAQSSDQVVPMTANVLLPTQVGPRLCFHVEASSLRH